VPTDGLQGGAVRVEAGSVDDGGAADVHTSDASPDDAEAGEVATCGSASIASVQALATEGASSKTVSIALTNVDAHDAIVVALDHNSFANAVVSDSHGNTYRPVVGPFDADSYRHWIFAALDVVGGTDTVTATLDSPGQNVFEFYVHEFHNVAAFDIGRASAGTATGKDAMNSGEAMTRCGNELIFGYGVTGAASLGTGFVPLSRFHFNVTEFRVAAEPGRYAATATMTTGTQWSMMMAAFVAK